MQASSSKRRHAFTLVELMAVIVLLGLLLSFVTVRLDGLTAGSRLTASAREVGATVGAGFALAVSSGKARSLNFDTETGEYWVGEDIEGPRDDAIHYGRLYDGVEFRDLQIGTEVFEERGVLSMEVSPLGAGTDAMIHLRSQSGAEMTVAVRPLTGTVNFLEGYVEYEEPEVEP